jgi:hypothetical protein
MTARPLSAAAPAPIGIRAAAYAADLLIAAAVGVACAGIAVTAGLAAGAAADVRALPLLFLVAAGCAWAGMLAWALVYAAMQGGSGSIGQRAFDLRLADDARGTPVGFWRALGRNAIWALSRAIVVGWFTPLFDAGPRHQGWHDRAARAVVVVERGTDAASPAVVVTAAVERVPVPPAVRVLAAAPTPTPAPAPAPAAAPATVAIRQLVGAAAGAAAPAGPSPWAPPPPAPTFEPPAERTAVAAASFPDLTRTASPSTRRAARFADAPVLAVLTWDDGSRMAVYERTVYGRNPAPESGAVTIPVRDETLSLSKTHFEIGGDASGAWIADRHSTNGTVLVRDGGRHPLVAGLPTSLRAGDRLEMGDRTAVVGLSS